jgi:hypothetical protein
MLRVVTRLLLAIFGVAVPGCGTFGDATTGLYEIDWQKVGTGEQAIVPVDDATHWHGRPLNMRPK